MNVISPQEASRVVAQAKTRVVRAACPHDCPDTCALLVTVEDGVATKVAGAPDHPFTDGTLCTKVAHYLERTYSPDRLLYPLKRVGKKGEGKFQRVSWDAALDEIAARLKEIAASPDGPQAILPYSYAGTMGQVQGNSMDRRFFHKLGASLLERTICSSAGKAGMKATIGGSLGTDPEMFVDSKLILIWGSNPIVSNLHFWSRVTEAKRRGAQVIAIDPYKSLSAEKCHQHIAPMPGTDAALALGMMHVLISEDLIDHDYIERYTLGFEQLKARVLAQYSPEKVARMTALDAHAIVALARVYGSVKPAAIRLNYGMQRHAGGGMAARTIACLPALIGAWRDPAGGILLSTGDFYGIDAKALERPDLIPGKPRSINMVQIGDALLQAQPPVRAIVVYNSNPVAVAPDSSKVVAGFAREDLFCVVLDSFQTDSADYADFVLPATTQLEHYDIHKSYGHLYMLANNPAIAPVGESLANSEIFRRLAARMGFTDACFKDSDEQIAEQAIAKSHPHMRGIEWNTLKQEGWQRISVAARHAPFARGNFPTPSGKCEFYSESLAQQGIDPLPFYDPPVELPQTNPQLAARYPLSFISPPARNFLNSSFANLPRFRAHEGEPSIELHSTDAEARGIRSGDWVRVYNDRGSMRLTAVVNDKPRAGVVVARSIWWRKFSPDRTNANEVTAQRVTDLGAGATFYDCLVEVEKIAAQRMEMNSNRSRLPHPHPASP